MTTIALSKRHTKSAEEIQAIVDKLEGELRSSLQLTTQRVGNQVKFSRSGVDGTLIIEDQQIDITIKLGMMMAMMASTIENEVRAKLDKYLS